jgi:carboxymethylenebutenolidase
MISLKSITTSLAALLLLTSWLATPSQSQAQDWALKRLENSPRHLEFVEIEAGKRKVNSFIAFPEVKEKAPVVIVIHEIFGLSDWVRGVTDQLAERGVIAIAPDLLSGTAPNGGGTSALGGGDGVRKAISSLAPDQITADLKAVVEYAKKLPASNGKVVVIGFCWGGGQTFRFATNTAGIEAFGAFYGTGPTEAADLAKITAPVHGFYGENDARVNATIASSTAAMKAAGKTYEPVIYKGAGHGFMRAGEAPDASEANKQARADAWKRLEAILAPLK